MWRIITLVLDQVRFGHGRIRRRGLVGVELEALAMFPVVKDSSLELL